MLSDPVELVARLLEASFPSAVVSREPPERRALSEDFYIYVQETSGGSSPVPGHQDSAAIDVVVFSQGGRIIATDRARQAQGALHDAWLAQTDLGHGYIRNWATVIKPYVQQLAGLPASTTRVVGSYSLSVRPPGH